MGIIEFKNLPDTSTPINATNLNLLQTNIIDMIYPVGSIYISTNEVNPNTLFGIGTWEKIEDRFLLSASSTYVAGSTGGEATHTLTIEEIPSHNHTNEKNIGGHPLGFTTGWNNNYVALTSNIDYNVGTNTLATGGGKSHNNMPPYLAVYMWKRTA